MARAITGWLLRGDTLQEAVANAREVIANWIQSAEKRGESVPERAAPPQVVTIGVAA